MAYTRKWVLLIDYYCTIFWHAIKILGLTADNASNNNTLVDELEDLLDGFQGSVSRIRCFAHILNLVVKVSISEIDALFWN